MLPTVRALRAAYPRTFIAVAASKGICELLTASRLVDEAIDLGIIKSSNQNFSGALGRVARLFKSARRTEPDLVLDLSPRLETQVFTSAVLRARAVTPSKPLDMLDRLLSRTSANRAGSRAADCRRVLKQIGVEAALDRLSINQSPEEDARFERLLADKGCRGGQPVVVLYSERGAPAEVWPIDKFAEIGERLAKNFAARIVAADEPGASDFTDVIGSMLPQGAIKLSQARAVEVVAAIARASLIITDEAGVAEMASDLGAPALEIARFKPEARLPKNRRVIHSAAPARITTDEVYELASEMLQESRLITLFER